MRPAPIVLENAWVRLEPLAGNHRLELREVADDAEAWRYATLSPAGSTPLGAFDLWFARSLQAAAAGHEIPFAVRRLSDGRAVGSTRYLNVEPVHRRIEIGNTWYAASARGTVVNPAAKLLLLGDAFEALGANRVELKIDARNERSRRAVLALGAFEEGTLRRHMVLGDGFVRDTVYFSVLDAEWPAVRARLHRRLGSTPPAPSPRIAQAGGPEEVALAAGLFREYAGSIGVDLGFQGFDAELAGLPGAYAPPGGRLLLVRDGEWLAGCGALRPLAAGIAEMKRMWIRPAFRGRGLGRAVAEALLRAAREAGYRAVRLDTLATMREARALYRALGFAEIPPYYANPLPGAVYMELALGPSR